MSEKFIVNAKESTEGTEPGSGRRGRAGASRLEVSWAEVEKHRLEIEVREATKSERAWHEFFAEGAD